MSTVCWGRRRRIRGWKLWRTLLILEKIWLSWGWSQLVLCPLHSQPSHIGLQRSTLAFKDSRKTKGSEEHLAYKINLLWFCLKNAAFYPKTQHTKNWGPGMGWGYSKSPLVFRIRIMQKPPHSFKCFANWVLLRLLSNIGMVMLEYSPET